jgi:protein-disulfide isomerase
LKDEILNMKPSIIASILFFALGVFGAHAGDAVPPPTAGPVVVEIDGAKITDAELQRKYQGRLFQAHTAYYQAERQALDEFIEEYLLEREAKAENVTVDQLLERHVNNAIAQDPPEDMLRLYYEVVNPQETYDKVRVQLLDHLRKIRLAKAKTAYIQSLHSKAHIMIGLQVPRTDISLKNAPVRGRADAPVVLVEYADYECPYCQQVQPAIDKIISEYKGKVALAYKDVPLPMHANAAKAAEAARCAETQGKFWEYHDLLFAKKQLDATVLKEYARDLKLDAVAFDKCLDTGARSELINAQLTEAQGLGIQGTPTFFINGRSTYGNLTVEQLRQIIDEELALVPSLPSQRAAANR